MKQFFSLLLFFVFMQMGAFAQANDFSYIINYNYAFQQESGNAKSVEHEDMLLLLNQDKSYFVSASKYQLDTFMQKNKGADVSRLLSYKNGIPKNRVKFEIEKDRKNAVSNYYEKIFTSTYKTTFKNNDSRWVLLQTTKTIGGYKCQEAKTKLGGRSFTVWYTMDIPISDGPYKFQGLPGLILEAYDDTKEHHFSLVRLTKTAVRYNAQHRNVVDADMKTIKTVRENQVENIRNSGFTVSAELMKKAKDKLSKQNNHIEKIE